RRGGDQPWRLRRDVALVRCRRRTRKRLNAVIHQSPCDWPSRRFVRAARGARNLDCRNRAREVDMNDVSATPQRTANAVVRLLDASALLLVRREGQGLEVRAGRRPLHVRFMPGVHVFPGGAIDPPDRITWHAEAGGETLGPKLARAARAALRETWEEVGVLV